MATRIIVTVPDELESALEEWEAGQAVAPSRSSVLRAALLEWLAERSRERFVASCAGSAPSLSSDEARAKLDELLTSASAWEMLDLEWTRSDVRWREDGEPFERKEPGPELTVRAVFLDPDWEDPRPGAGEAE